MSNIRSTGIFKPEYARLRNVLLSSGIQKTNPPLFQIVEKLINTTEQFDLSIIAILQALADLRIGKIQLQSKVFVLGLDDLLMTSLLPTVVLTPSIDTAFIMPICSWAHSVVTGTLLTYAMGLTLRFEDIADDVATYPDMIPALGTCNNWNYVVCSGPAKFDETGGFPYIGRSMVMWPSSTNVASGSGANPYIEGEIIYIERTMEEVADTL